ncbi:hypothetical protein ACJX0J_028391 [Zea mays]
MGFDYLLLYIFYRFAKMTKDYALIMHFNDNWLITSIIYLILQLLSGFITFSPTHIVFCATQVLQFDPGFKKNSFWAGPFNCIIYPCQIVIQGSISKLSGYFFSAPTFQEIFQDEHASCLATAPELLYGLVESSMTSAHTLEALDLILKLFKA